MVDRHPESCIHVLPVPVCAVEAVAGSVPHFAVVACLHYCNVRAVVEHTFRPLLADSEQ